MAQPIDFRIGMPRVREINIPQGQNSLGAFFGGLSSGLNVGLARKQRKAGEGQSNLPPFDTEGNPTKNQASRVELGKIGQLLSDVSQSFLGAPAEQKKAADPLFDLRKKLAEQKVQMNSLEIFQALEQRQKLIEAEKSVLEGTGFITDAIKNGNTLDSGFQSQLFDFMRKNPEAWERMAPTLQLLQRAQQFEQNRIEQQRQQQERAAEQQRRQELLNQAREQGLEPSEFQLGPPEERITLERPDQADQADQLELGRLQATLGNLLLRKMETAQAEDRARISLLEERNKIISDPFLRDKPEKIKENLESLQREADKLGVFEGAKDTKQMLDRTIQNLEQIIKQQQQGGQNQTQVPVPQNQEPTQPSSDTVFKKWDPESGRIKPKFPNSAQ